MKNPIESLNKLFDSRIRLGVMSILVVNPSVSFNELKQMLELTDGNLASHLNTLEQAELRNQLDDLLDDVPLVNPTYVVNDNGANIKVKGQWAGLRAGLAVGFRF